MYIECRMREYAKIWKDFIVNDSEEDLSVQDYTVRCIGRDT